MLQICYNLVSKLDFTDFNYPEKPVDELDLLTIGLNWFLNKNVWALFNYSNADFENGEDGNVFVSQFQIFF